MEKVAVPLNALKTVTEPPVEEAVETPDAPKEYRILLPLYYDARRTAVSLRFALLLARALDGRVVLLDVTAPGPSQHSQPQKKDAQRLLDELVDEQEGSPPPVDVITREHNYAATAILNVAREEQCTLVLLHWDGQSRGLRTRLGQILDPVVQESPCPVALLAGDFSPVTNEADIQHILTPLAGGSHASCASTIAAALAQQCHATLKLLTVVSPQAEPAVVETTQENLGKTEADIREKTNGTELQIETEIVRASKVEATLAETSREHDLVFLGATNDSVLNRLLVGSVAERLAERIAQPVVIVREPQAAPQRWMRRFWRWLDNVLPHVELEDRLEAYKHIRRGARASGDFYALIVCSVIIATMGLFLGSGAVIIGAMLVAPLMTPILALGLGVVMGDRRLLRIAAVSTVMGAGLAVAASFILTWFAPFVLFTTEIESRTQPNLFDLTVALAAGAAGAYSVVRRNLAAALPGVAIAAALVPPLAVLGISLATQRWVEARGAALLFGANLVAIAFAAALIYLLFGFFTEDDNEEERERIWRWGFVAMLVLFALVAIPLTRNWDRMIDNGMLERTIDETLRSELSDADLSLLNFEWDASADAPLEIKVVVYGNTADLRQLRSRIYAALSDAMEREVDVRLLVLPVQEIVEE